MIYSEGLATSFFNDKNRPLARDLIQLLIESKQDTPQWLETLAAEGHYNASQRRTPIRRYIELLLTDCVHELLKYFLILLNVIFLVCHLMIFL